MVEKLDKSEKAVETVLANACFEERDNAAVRKTKKGEQFIIFHEKFFCFFVEGGLMAIKDDSSSALISLTMVPEFIKRVTSYREKGGKKSLRKLQAEFEKSQQSG